MNYRINEQEMYWEICAEKPIEVEDCCYDITKDEFVIAVKHYKGQNYSVEYIILNREHKVVRVLSEKQGVNPKFILAPDKSVWVSMSSLRTKKEGEIVLPLYERERITKEIVKSDLGTDFRFFWNGSFWGYVHDMWGNKVPDKLLQYEFDKKGLYKTRKAYKLQEHSYAVPFVQEDTFYLCQRDYDKGIARIFKMYEPGNTEEICEPALVGQFMWCRLVNVGEETCKMIGIEDNEITSLLIDKQGKLLEKQKIYTIDDTTIYSVLDFKVSEEGMVAFTYVSEHQAGIIEIKDNVAREVFRQKDNVLYCNGAEIATENKFAFGIMTDGKCNYYLATNIEARNGRCTKIYVCEGK